MGDSGRERRLKHWLESHAGIVWKIVRALARNPDDRDELWQEIVLQLWVSIPRFQGDCRETTWIYRVAINTAMVWKRGQRRRVASAPVEVLESPLARQAADHRDRRHVIETLYEAIRQLSPVDASLALLHLDGLSYQEIAEILGITENYVGVKLTRIRRQLATTLQGISDEL